MKTLDLSIIIVSFNTRELTIACIESILASVKKVSYEIIVVDNNSSDDSVEYLKKMAGKEPKLSVIANHENAGFSKANNIGIAKSSGRYVLCLNSDTVVYEDTLDGMVKFMDDTQDAGAATCFVRLPNGKLDDSSHRGFPTPTRALFHFSGLSKLGGRIFGGYNLKHMDLSKIHQIEALAGSFMMIRREAGNEAGWWDERYFFYGEDLDFCYTLAELGWKIYFVPDFEILHYKGVTGGIKKISQNITTANLAR